MTPHEAMQELLALSAAGLLEPGEERRVREHVRECAECAARLDALAALAAGLAALPAPVPPADLLVRTQARVAAGLALDADRRRGALLAAGAGLFAWMMILASWLACRALGGGALLPWLALYSVAASLAAPAAAALLVRRRRLERSIP